MGKIRHVGLHTLDSVYARTHPHRVVLPTTLEYGLDEAIVQFIRSRDIVGGVFVTRTDEQDPDSWGGEYRRQFTLHCNHHTDAVALKMRWG